MTRVLVEMDAQQVDEIRQRFPGGSFEYDGLEDGYFVAGEGVSPFVQRCIGTVIELEAFQASGGVMLLESADGTVREVFLDPSRNGATLRPTKRRRRGPVRRRGRQG